MISGSELDNLSMQALETLVFGYQMRQGEMGEIVTHTLSKLLM